ncbi:MAG: methylenetetrahydrofolate reductase [NAD(P)H] [Coriobacteriia bacterium]|nr:methylenetetrahydrofolate reductase [NAD(P)H] [Coriobacteriia bacterium]MCL2537236.1 methylenetetrahydrofolate reductase [NAD(P)H] [Coriobacteriia bacterium]
MSDFVFSFEVYPPKKTAPIEVIYEAIAQLSQLKPDYISVTYGAGGGAATASATVEICSLIRNTYHTETVAHLPGINLTFDQVASLLTRLRAHNIMSILALRGDRRPEDCVLEQEGDFHYASELVSYIRELDPRGDFSISAACYPEVHIEASSAAADLDHLKLKVEAGVTNLITQLFFDNRVFYQFLDACSVAGIDVPIQAGIMPLTNARQAAHIIKLCNPHIPADLQAMIERYQDDDASFEAAGIEYATQQIADLIDNAAEGVHLYTMNSASTARAITDSIYPLLGR